MKPNKPTMRMPELLVFANPIAVGFVGAEVFRSAFHLSINSSLASSDASLFLKASAILSVAAMCLTYAIKRGAHVTAMRIGNSFRIDLLLATCIGIWINEIISPLISIFHEALESADPSWASAVLLLLCTVLFWPLVQLYWPRPTKKASQLYFMSDEEIDDEGDDLLANEAQAKSFANVVLASDAHSGLVFGVDGPWGVGKTSFMNLAESHWREAQDRVIVCRFEPLRYASEPDLADRLIRELTASIQRNVFAPEFRPAATRYSRLIKGKADVSFLGFKISLEPSQETVDELLEDIDEVLRRMGRRVIIVIDDLDRLDTKTTNNVLFATRRTFKLSQATYILCYDTEILAGSSEEGERAREFLEKFVTVKLSLFVDSSSIRNLLRRNWQRPENKLGSIPSDTMVKLGSVLTELADILDSDLASNYLPLVGNIRKVKRFVNSMLLMQIEKSNLGRTDFNTRDLINLILLHINYPGLFRRIYAEETEGRIGSFSVRRNYQEHEFMNSESFSKLTQNQPESAEFLLMQLFDVGALDFGDPRNIEESVLRTRACFNHKTLRNLEGYLKLIVRFATPDPQETFVFYQAAVERVLKGESISSILKSPDFTLEQGKRAEHVHDKFWSMLVNKSHAFTIKAAQDAIDSLVDNLPHYSAIDSDDRGLRQRSIYSLIRLLDNAGWGRTDGHRRANKPENIIEIAWRIFGEHSHDGNGLIYRLAGSERGVLGWNDLMLFRLQCSIDRQGQLHNLHSALIVYQDKSAATSGLVSNLALMGMRKLSQEVFALFKRTYIETRRNFFSEVSDAPNDDFLGEALSQPDQQALEDDSSESSIIPIDQRISSTRSAVKTFVIYQLSNKLPPTGSGVGCGYYDEIGDGDGGGISKSMSEYVFDVCFNPEVHEDNVFHFLDHCLSHLSNSFFSDRNQEGYFASKTELPGGLDPARMGQYWDQHRNLILRRVREIEERHVVTPNYIASYSEDLIGVITALDELANEAK